eukprot:374293-Prymnesium_polylepis.1
MGCSIGNNELCGINEDRVGAYNARGIFRICEALKLNSTLVSIRCHLDSPARFGTFQSVKQLMGRLCNLSSLE